MLPARAPAQRAAGLPRVARARRRRSVAALPRCAADADASAEAPVAAEAPAPAECAPPPPPTADAALLQPLPPPLPQLRWSTSVDAAAAVDVFQFSAAAGGGLPLWSPAGLAVTLVALAAARRGRASRHSAVEELSALLTARRTPIDEEARAAAAETVEQLKARQQAEAKRRTEEAAQEAARAEEQRRVREAEEARIQAEQAAARAEFEAQQRILDAEQRARDEAAAALRREAERKAAAEEAVRQAEAEAERRRREAEAQRQREEDRKRRGIKTLTARFRGELGVACVPGALYEATVHIRVVGAAAAETVEKREVRTAQELRAAVPLVCRAAAGSVVGAFGGDARAKSLLGEGPLTVLDDSELDYWLRLLRVLLAATAARSLWRLAAEAEVGGRGGRGAGAQARLTAELALTDARDVAPPADEASVRGRMERAVQAVSWAGDVEHARALLEQLVAEQRAALSRDTGMERVHAAFYATVLTLAYFLDCAGDLLKPPGEALAACHAFAAVLLEAMLRNSESSTWNSFYLDGERLSASDDVVDAAKEILGESHPLTGMLVTLAGPAAKAPAAEEEAWPDEGAVRSARIAEAQQSVPVPERVWAMRNAAGTLALTGARQQAVDLLSRAVALKAEWLGCDTHGALLGELCDLHDVLDDEGAAADVAARILAVCEAVAEERAAAGRTQEAIDILESAAAEYHAAAGGAAARLQARAAALGSAGRPAAGGGGVRALAAALAPELEVRRTSARRIE